MRWQIVASMVKVPLLFYLTLLVTLPSLYVFNALVGSRLTLATVVRLLVASLGVMVAVLASLGPIVAFFSVSTTSYPFMLLFNVVVCGVSGGSWAVVPAPDAAPAEHSRFPAVRPCQFDVQLERPPDVRQEPAAGRSGRSIRWRTASWASMSKGFFNSG